MPRGHRLCSSATPGSASASARMASACTCASRVESSASRPSTLLVNARSANAAPRAASAAATSASARTATKRGSPCSLGKSWWSCARTAPSAESASHSGSRRARRSAAVANASWGPRSYRARRRRRSVAHQRGSAVSNARSEAAASPASSSSSAPAEARRRFRASAALRCASASPRRDAAAACRGLPEVEPASIKHVVAPRHKNSEVHPVTANPGDIGFGECFAATPFSFSFSSRADVLVSATYRMTGASPPRSSTPLFASAPTICTPQRRAVRPYSASARESERVPGGDAPGAGFERSAAIKSTAASSAGRSARAAAASAASAAPAPSVSRARSPADSTSRRARATASATFWRSVCAFREGDAVITRAASS